MRRARRVDIFYRRMNVEERRILGMFYIHDFLKGEWHMSRRKRSVMSENLKVELAKDLGFYDTVQQEGWGGIKAKDAGNMVKRAIELAERAASREP